MIVTEINAGAVRGANNPDLHPQFPNRWSPRAMSGEALDRQEINTLLEAARWSPSSFNAQPWRFAVVERDTEHWPPLFETLVEANQTWVKNAAVMFPLISRTLFEHNGRPAATHAFDAGAAWMALALQASHMGLVAHGMQGFDSDAARKVLAVPEVYQLNAIIAVGRPGDIDDLPEKLRERETPSLRKELDDIGFSGSFHGLDN